MLADPALGHVNFDISWDEVAKYAVVVAGDDRARGGDARTGIRTGSCSAPTRWRRPSPAPYFAVFDMWAPVWRQLTPEASLKVRKGNYERIFDAGPPARARLGTGERQMRSD